MQRLPGQGPHLRLKQRGKKERMVGYFDRLDSCVVASRRQAQSVTREPIHKRRSEPEIAPVETDKRRAAA